MLKQQRIVWPGGHSAQLVHLEAFDQLAAAATALTIGKSRPTLVLVGGASLISQEQKQILPAVMKNIAAVIEDVQAVAVDGGTDAGIMSAIGQVRAANSFAFPLIGVAVRTLVTWPGDDENPHGSPLEAHHTHFVLVPGDEWGDECGALAGLGSKIANGQPSLTVLMNGGDITRRDVIWSMREERPLLVLAGTGRLADEIARQEAHHPLITVCDVDNAERVSDIVGNHLTSKRQL